MLNNISQTRFAIYATTTNAKIKKHIIRGLKAKRQNGSKGDYYSSFRGLITRLERSDKIINLIHAVNKMSPHKRDKGKIPFLVRCASGYLDIRKHYDIKKIDRVKRVYWKNNDLNIRCHADVIWQLSDGRTAYVLYYLFKFKDVPDAERLNATKAAIAASIMAQKIEYNEKSVFIIADLKNGIHFEIADDGSRLVPQITTTATNIVEDAA